jgi:hypothetical protein
MNSGRTAIVEQNAIRIVPETSVISQLELFEHNLAKHSPLAIILESSVKP